MKKHIHWISWETICKTKDEGGLGMKYAEVMNAALIRKWKWRILLENNAIWSGILKARYGNIKLNVLVGDSLVVGKKVSLGGVMF